MANSLQYAIELTAQTEGVTKGLKQARKDVAKQSKAMTDTQVKQATKINKIKKELLGKEKKSVEDALISEQSLLKKRLRTVEKNSKEEYEIKKEFIEKFENLRKKQLQIEEKQGEQGKALKGLKQGASDAAGEISGLGGALSSALGGLGPWGQAASVVAGAVAGLSAGAVAAARSFDEFNDTLQKMKGTGTLTAKEIKEIGVRLLEIPRPASMSAAAMAEVAQTVANFAKDADAIPKITGNIAALVAAYPDVNPVEVTQGMQRLTTQLGDADKAFDVLAAQAQAMKGKSLDPLGEASTELGTVFTKASVAIKDTGVAMERSSQLFNAFLGVGNEVGEATSTSEIIFEQLSATLNDTAAVEKMQTALKDTGQTLDSVGLAAGDVDPAKLLAFLQGGAEGAGELKGAMGGALDDLLVLGATLEKSGKSISDFTLQTAGAGAAVADMATESQKANDAIVQNFDNLMINVGASTGGIVTDVTGMFASVLGGVASLFEPAERTFDKAIVKAQGFNETIEDLNFILDNPSPNTEKQLGFINDQLDSIAEVEPFVAAEIEKIQNNKSLGTEEQLTQINALLEGTITLAEGLRDVEAFDAMAAAADMMGESLFESVSGAGSAIVTIDEIAKNAATGGIAFLGEQIGLWERDASVSQAAIADAFAEVDKLLPKTRDELTKLRDEYKALPAGSQEQVDKLKEMSAASTKLNDLTKRRTIQQNAITKSAETTLEAQIQLNDASIEGLDVQDVYLTALAQAPEPLQRSLEFQTQLKEEVEKQFNAVVDTNKAEETLVDTTIKELKTQGKITFANGATRDEKLEVLKATREQLVLEERLLAIEIDKAQRTGMEASLIEAMVAQQAGLVESIALVDGSLAGMAGNTAVAAEEATKLTDAMQKVLDETEKVAQSTKDIKFEASIAGLEGAEKELAKLEYEYEKMVEGLPDDLKESQEHMEALWENHQAKVGAIQKKATEEREAESLKVAADAAKKREEAHKAAMAERERLAKEAAEREKARQEEMAKIEEDRTRRAEERAKRLRAISQEITSTFVESAGRVEGVAERFKIIEEAITQYRLAIKDDPARADSFVNLAGNKLAGLTFAPIISEVEELNNAGRVSAVAFNGLIDAITEPRLKAAFEGFKVGVVNINATIADIDLDILLDTQTRIVNSVHLTNEQLEQSRVAIETSIDLLKEEEGHRREIGLLSNLLSINILRGIDQQQEAEELAIRRNALTDKSIDKERELEQLAIEKNKQRIEELDNLEKTEAVQRQIVELGEANAELIAKEKERRKILTDQLKLLKSQRKELADAQKEILEGVTVKLNAYQEERQAIIDNAEGQKVANNNNLIAQVDNLQATAKNIIAERKVTQEIERQAAIKAIMADDSIPAWQKEVAIAEKKSELDKKFASEITKIKQQNTIDIEDARSQAANNVAAIETNLIDLLKDHEGAAITDTIKMVVQKISAIRQIGKKTFDTIKGALNGGLVTLDDWGTAVTDISGSLSDVSSEAGAIGGLIGSALSLLDEFLLLLDDSDEKAEARAEIARQYDATIQASNDHLAAQQVLYQQLIDSGSVLLDTEKERLKTVQEIKDVTAGESSLKGFGEGTAESVVLIGDANLDQLFAARQVWQDMLNAAKIAGSSNVKSLEQGLAAIETQIDLSFQLLAIEKNITTEVLDLIDLKNRLGATEANSIKDRIQQLKHMQTVESEITGTFLFSEAERLGFAADILDLEGQLIDEREKEALLLLQLQGVEKGSVEFMETRLGFLDEQIDRAKELGITGTEYLELLVERMDLEESITKEMDKQSSTLSGMKLLQQKLAALDHEHALDRIDDEEYLEDKLKLLEEMWQLSIDTNAPIEEQRKLELAIHDLLEEQKRLKEESLGLDDKALKKLGELVRKRQKVIEQFRAGQVGGEAVEETNRQIRTELVSQGMSDAEIAQFMATLPQRQEGGPVDEGLVFSHDNEYILNAKAVAKYGAGFMDRLNNLQVPVPESPVMRHLTGAAMQNNNAQSIVINVQVANDWEINGNADAAEQIASQQKEFLYDAINQGIKSRRINLISGGRV